MGRSALFVLQLALILCAVACSGQPTTPTVTVVDESGCKNFIPEGEVIVQGSRATLCCIRANTAYVLEGIYNDTCRVVELPEVPLSVYDSVALFVRNRMPASGIATILSSEIRPEHELGVEIGSPWVVTRFKQLRFRNNTTLDALVRVHVGVRVQHALQNSWFPFVVRLTYRYPSLELIGVVPFEIDTLKPYVQDVTMAYTSPSTVVCSSFDVLKFDRPDLDNVVVAEHFGMDGRRLPKSSLRIPTSIAKHPGYVGWLSGFIPSTSGAIIVNDVDGRVLYLPYHSGSDFTVLDSLPRPDSAAKLARYFRGEQIVGSPLQIVEDEFIATDSTRNRFLATTYLCAFDPRNPQRFKIDSRYVDNEDKELRPFYRRSATGELIQSRFQLKREAWQIVHTSVRR